MPTSRYGTRVRIQGLSRFIRHECVMCTTQYPARAGAGNASASDVRGVRPKGERLSVRLRHDEHGDTVPARALVQAAGDEGSPQRQLSWRRLGQGRKLDVLHDVLQRQQDAMHLRTQRIGRATQSTAFGNVHLGKHKFSENIRIAMSALCRHSKKRGKHTGNDTQPTERGRGASKHPYQSNTRRNSGQ